MSFSDTTSGVTGYTPSLLHPSPPPHPIPIAPTSGRVDTVSLQSFGTSRHAVGLYCIKHCVFMATSCPAYLTSIVRTVTAACSRSDSDQHPPLILLALIYGADSASVPSHTLSPQHGTLCLQTFVPSGT